MPPESRDAAHLWDMLSAAREACAVAAGLTLEEFLADRLRLRALERTLELLGEAARRVTPQMQSGLPDIPWRALIGQRNLLAHEYGRIDSVLLYRTATQDLPPLIVILEGITLTRTDRTSP
ncbi:MAG: DUF86 domain-containing protein [Burkholderiales bacterium]